MRLLTPLALLTAITLGCAHSAYGQEDSRPSISQRLASLRLGWGSDEVAEPEPRAAVGATTPSQRAGSNLNDEESASLLGGRLPRLNPSDLLQGGMFTGRSPDSNSQRATSAQLREQPTPGNRSGAAVGSARARIMRDLRAQTPGDTEAPPATAGRLSEDRQRVEDTVSGANLAPRPGEQAPPMVLGRASARAGSVLSASAPSDTTAAPQADPPTPVRPQMINEADLRRELLGPASLLGSSSRTERADTATAKSIAAAVASSMAEEGLRARTTVEDANADELINEPSAPPAIDETPTLAEQRGRSDEIPPAPLAQLDHGPADGDIAARYAAGSYPPLPLENPEPAPTHAPEPAAAEPATIGSNPDSGLAQLPAESPTYAADPQAGLEQDAANPPYGEAIERFTPAQEEPTWPAAAPSVSSPSYTAHGDRDDADLLLNQRMPQIVSRVSGPKQIIIGREAVYRVTIANRGDETADQLDTTVTVPDWAEVMGSRGTVGLVEPPATRDGATSVLWRIADLPPGRSEHLDLKLIARQGRPIDLGVNWKHAPVGSHTVVEVQEPKLAVALDGPDEILFGKPQQYRLHVSNPGTGAAEEVRVKIAPGGESIGATHAIGNLAPNELRTITFEVTGSKAGEMQLLAQALGAGNLMEISQKSVFCRKPELEVDWRGPARKYAGAPAVYYFRVRNPGTATAEGVEFRVNLPPGFEVAKASAGGKADSTGRQMRWGVGSLRAGDDYYMELQGVINQPGVNEFAMGAADADRLATASTTAATEVIALADLKLDIRDPKGPLPVGREAVYEVRVTNRGTSAAQQVRIVGLFSEGIEPYKVEGAEASIADGRVAVRTLDRLNVGSELVVLIHTRATTPGAHIFRAEVLCQDIDIKLAAEETTRFYAEEPIDLGEGPLRSAGVADRFAAPQ